MQTMFRMLLVAVVVGVFMSGKAAWPEIRPPVRLDHSVLESGREGEVHVLLEYSVPEGKPNTEHRPPLNLAVVIDRSGSMADRGKLDYARRAALTLIDNLTPLDRLTLVQYDDQAQILWNGARVGDGQAVRDLVRSMEPGGSTNVHDGLERGVSGCIRGRHEESLNRVFLLSDGLANVGLTSPASIAAVASRGRAQGVRVSAMGLGAEYDEDLMQAVAEAGGGSYHFIENPAQTARIYERELRMLSAMVTRDFRLRFISSPLVKEVTVYGYPSERSADAWAVTMDDLHAGEKRLVIMRLGLKALPDAVSELGRFEWEYVDVSTGGKEHAHQTVSVRGSTDRTEITAGVDTSVLAESHLARAELEHREAVRLFENGQIEQAGQRLQALKSTLADQVAAAPSVALRKKMEALDVEVLMQQESQSNEALRDSYLKKSKVNIYNSAKGKRQAVMLEPGDQGPEVLALQESLRAANRYAGALDGAYSSDLEQAVRLFQQEKGLDADGVAGPRTLRELGLY